jgi:hypothetical protein
MPIVSFLAVQSSYVTAAFGLLGTLVGGLITGTVSIFIARHSRQAAEFAWFRDSRSRYYDRFLIRAWK